MPVCVPVDDFNIIGNFVFNSFTALSVSSEYAIGTVLGVFKPTFLQTISV